MASSRRLALAWALVGLAAGPACDRPRPAAGGGRSPVEAPVARRGLAEIESIESLTAAGQTIYVPAYSHVAVGDQARPFNLAVTLSVRNTDRAGPIVVASIRYYDRDGRLARDYLKKPVRVAPLAALEIFLPEGDTTGGTSACFLVDWVAERPVSDPAVEAVMVGTASTQGVSFVCPGRVVADRARAAAAGAEPDRRP